MSYIDCPFTAKESDHLALWEMLIYRDINAFIAANWDHVKNDFIAAEFQAIHANFSFDPSQWDLAFPHLESYRDEWLKQAAEAEKCHYLKSLDESLFKLSYLDKIDINGNRASVRKCFNGIIETTLGQQILKWQTIYLCKKLDKWKISGFIGYLPFNE